MKTAFLAVHFQNAWAGNNPCTASAIESAAEKARRKRLPVVWAYTNLFSADIKPTKFGELKNTPEYQDAVTWESNKNNGLYLPAATPRDDDWIISNRGRSVLNNSLNTDFFKDELGLGTLSVGGFRTAQCVWDSCRDSLSKGFNVKVNPNLTADRRDGWETAISVVFRNVFRGRDVELCEGPAFLAS